MQIRLGTLSGGGLSKVVADVTLGKPHHGFRINGQQVVQWRDLIRAISAKPINRKNRRVTLEFTTTVEYPTIDSAEAQLLGHFLEGSKPLDADLVTVVAGRAGGAQSFYQYPAVVTALDAGYVVGRTVWFSYRTEGPMLTLAPVAES
jgi:hypothetical protein